MAPTAQYDGGPMAPGGWLAAVVILAIWAVSLAVFVNLGTWGAVSDAVVGALLTIVPIGQAVAFAGRRWGTRVRATVVAVSAGALALVLQTVLFIDKVPGRTATITIFATACAATILLGIAQVRSLGRRPTLTPFARPNPTPPPRGPAPPMRFGTRFRDEP
jgi:hypothetical protein